MNIQEYISTRTERGACKCGKCIDATPGNPQPEGHAVDMVFFKVAPRGDTNPEEFKRITRETKGEFSEFDPLDGRAYSYTDIGAWIGDQSAAMRYMALGSMLGVFTLITPMTMGAPTDSEEAKQMAGNGFLLIEAKKENHRDEPS